MVVIVIADRQRLPQDTPDDTKELDVVRARWLPVECRQLRGGGGGHKVALARSLINPNCLESLESLESFFKKEENFQTTSGTVKCDRTNCIFQKKIMLRKNSFLMLFKNSGLTYGRGLN